MINLRTLPFSLRQRLNKKMSSLKRCIPVRFHECLFLPLNGDHVFDAMNMGGYEGKEIAFMGKYLARDHIFWDVGSNFGLYTVLAARNIKDHSRILAIEPDPKNFHRLRINLLLNGIWLARTLQSAISDHKMPYVDFTSCSQGSYSSLKVAQVPGLTKHIRVPQTTLDDLAEQLGRPGVDLLKMDVEGAELLVLKGGNRFFTHYPRPAVMCEFSDRRTIAFDYPASRIYDWFTEREYVLCRIVEQGLLLPVEAKERYEYDNLIACPKEKLGRMPLMHGK